MTVSTRSTQPCLSYILIQFPLQVRPIFVAEADEIVVVTVYVYYF
jgi:hypothetical protein